METRKNMRLVKAEILWTRKCPLHCEYCAMADGRGNTISFEHWVDGVNALSKLGCKFFAFYGAEPLHDFENLPAAVDAVESQGINCTVITSGMVSDLRGKLNHLYDYGLRSLTMSYDGSTGLDTSSGKKSSLAVGTLDYFRSLGPVRDVAVVVTLSRKNFLELPTIIKDMSARGIWTFFDFIHPDRDQPGSKVRTTKNTEDLLFRSDDLSALAAILGKVRELKGQGFLCHASDSFLEKVERIAFSLSHFEHVPQRMIYCWNCAKEDNFPAWVTIDCDGRAWPCDDFQPGEFDQRWHLSAPGWPDPPHIYMWELFNKWAEFKQFRKFVKENCPGCLWNTHIDAHTIKRGELAISEYIHGMNNGS